MKLAHIDPFASPGGHETMAARQPRNAAQPFRHLLPSHVDTVARGSIGGLLVSIHSGCARRHRYNTASYKISPVAVLSADGHLLWSQADRANNWYHPSAESHRDVPQGDTGVQSIQVRMTSGPHVVGPE